MRADNKKHFYYDDDYDDIVLRILPRTHVHNTNVVVTTSLAFYIVFALFVKYEILHMRSRHSDLHSSSRVGWLASNAKLR